MNNWKNTILEHSAGFICTAGQKVFMQDSQDGIRRNFPGQPARYYGIEQAMRGVVSVQADSPQVLGMRRADYRVM
jgi:hypothetical protein